jgi:hypothetical protein
MTGMVRGAGLALMVALALAGCAGIGGADTDFPPPQPPPGSTHFKATPPGEFPVDVYLAMWGEGYVVYAPGRAPIYLISDKKGGFVIQRPGQRATFVARRPDGSGWNILSATEPATYLLKQQGGSWILQAPGDLPTVIVPQ